MPPKNNADDKFSNGTNGSNDLKNIDINLTYAKKTATHKNNKFRGTAVNKAFFSNVNNTDAIKQPFEALKCKCLVKKIKFNYFKLKAYNDGCKTSFEFGKKNPLLNRSIIDKNPLPAPFIAPTNTIIT